MILDQLEIRDFRNIEQIALEPHPRLNLITGRNGAGKSAILEAIQCLSTGHTFRTRRARELIRRDTASLTLTTRFTDPDTSRQHRCGLQRHRDGQVDLRLDFEEVRSQVQITRLLPIKVLTPDSHRLVQEGPEERRQFLDWGVFHVEPRFFDHWRQFRRSLSQRNQLLRENGSARELSTWNSLLVESANHLDAFRSTYISQLNSYLQGRMTSLDAMFHVKLHYRRGWNPELPLIDLLESNLDLHRRMKTTTDGPHRADIQLLTDGMPARQYLSRGQQKVLVYLLHLAQLDILQQARNVQAIVLCDDLTAELDQQHAVSIIQQLLALDGQVFVSGVDLSTLQVSPHRAFHVEHGAIRNVV